MINIGIVGLGWMGRIHFRLLESNKSARVVAVADRSEQALDAVVQENDVDGYTDHRDMLERKDLDAVIVATPATSHYAIVRDCIRAEKHILCEKPLAMNRKEVNSIRDMVKKSGLKFMVNFPQRYAVSTEEAKYQMALGLLGPVDYIRGNFRFSMKKHGETHGGWVFDRDQAGGLILESSVHLWDTVRYLTEQEVVEVIAVAHEVNVNNKPLEDNFVAIAYMDGGGIAAIDMSGSLPLNTPTDKRFELIGKVGCAYIDDFRHYISFNSEKGIEANPGEQVTGLTYPDVMWHSQIEGGVKRVHREFIRCLRENDEPSPGVEDGARACEITWAVMDSLKSKRLERVQYGG